MSLSSHYQRLFQRWCRGSMQIRWRSPSLQWRIIISLLLAAYLFFYVLLPTTVPEEHKQMVLLPEGLANPGPVNPKILRPKIDGKDEKDNAFSFKLNYRGKDIYIESVLTHSSADTLEKRVTLDPKLTQTRRIIKTADAPFNQENLGGCPDWNCELSSGRDSADVLIMMSPRVFDKTLNPETIYVFYSQESTRNSVSLANSKSFNMTLGYRHDSPAASPYGYTAKLAPQSRKPDGTSVVDEDLIKGKTKGVAWFVSHCNTQSRREDLIKELQTYIQVDIYGGCGPLKCQKGTNCETSLDTDYHFYLSVENSICEYYITEKLWNQGYGHTVIPIVLKRSLVEPYAPPGSFIAFDDYENIEEMGKHLTSLMNDKVAYSKYFDWRRKYVVIYLNGQSHDALERPWGFCQLCRMAHLIAAGTPHTEIPLYQNENLAHDWDNSCEADGALAGKLLKNLRPDKVAHKSVGAGSKNLVTSAMSIPN